MLMNGQLLAVAYTSYVAY